MSRSNRVNSSRVGGFGPQVDAWPPFAWQMLCHHGTMETWLMPQSDRRRGVEASSSSGCLATDFMADAWPLWCL
jgi:hypothetical protein